MATESEYKPVIGYVRVSGQAQVDNGAGLPIQHQAIQAFCRRHEMSLVRVVEDRGVSGNIEDRPGLVEVEEMLRCGAAQAVLVHRYDRLARDLMIQEITIARWAELGAPVISVLEGEAGDNPSRVMVRQIMGAVAQYDRAMTVARLRWGRQMKARRGGFAGGQVALGYQSVDGRLEIDVAEAATVRMIVGWKREDWSCYRIAKELNRRGVPTKRGRTWYPGTVRRLLSAAQPRGRMSFAGETVKGEHPALVRGVR